MKLFHSTGLRQWMAILFLITSAIIQVQAVYACEQMGNQLRTSCCCEVQHLEDCPMLDDCDSDESTSDSCCATGITLPPESNLSNINAGHSRDVLTYNFEQPDAIFIATPINPFNTPIRLLFVTHANVHWYDGTDTYLLTLRFRV